MFFTLLSPAGDKCRSFCYHLWEKCSPQLLLLKMHTNRQNAPIKSPKRLPHPCPHEGPRRWRDIIRKDLKTINATEDKWYEDATLSRAGWRATDKAAIEEETIRQYQSHRTTTQNCMTQVECEICRYSFRRESDKARHKINKITGASHTPDF